MMYRYNLCSYGVYQIGYLSYRNNTNYIIDHDYFWIWDCIALAYQINSYWCSIWKLRCPVNQSLKKDCSISQVAFIWSLIHGSAVSRSMSIGMWFDWLTQVNQWLSSTLTFKNTLALLFYFFFFTIKSFKIKCFLW